LRPTVPLGIRSFSDVTILSYRWNVGFRMNFEIERKFLVRDREWEQHVRSRSIIRQAYLDSAPKVSIRIRIKDNTSATLTLKSRPSSLRRLELEYPIPTLEAEALMQLRRGAVVEKVRHIVPYGDGSDNLRWEIDTFFGENEGLVVAEIELPDEHHQIELPPWIGAEVTGQSQYYNGTLSQHPYSSWPHEDAAERRA
jgi:adenylate cyclase